MLSVQRKAIQAEPPPTYNKNVRKTAENYALFPL